jgi:hypothetical protein
LVGLGEERYIEKKELSKEQEKQEKEEGKDYRHVEEFESTISVENAEEVIAKNRMQQRGVNRDY